MPARSALRAAVNRLDHGSGAIEAPAPICAVELPQVGVQPVPTEQDSVAVMLRQLMAMLSDQKKQVQTSPAAGQEGGPETIS